MTEKFIKALESYGFKIDKSGRGILSAFCRETYVLEPHVLVQGDHATDIAVLHYSDLEEINGICYYSSLMERVAMSYSAQEIDKILKKINKYSDTDLKLKSCNGYVFVVSECDERDLELNTLDYCVSDMVKAIGVLDYMLKSRFDYLERKRMKELKIEN